MAGQGGTPAGAHGARAAHRRRDLELIAAHLLAEDPVGRRFAAALRRTIDMLLDGQHTGRDRSAPRSRYPATFAGMLLITL